MTKLNLEIFKAYDIRGIYNQDFDKNFAYKLGLTYLAFLKKNNPEKNNWKIVVGRDMRLSSPKLSESLIKGLISAGADVLDIGLVSTPTFYFSISYLQADGGLIVSASHNPKEWNGFKVVTEKAKPISFETGLSWIRDNINNFSKIDNPGNLLIVNDVLEKQTNHDLEYIDKEKIKPIKIAADAANSMGATYLSVLAKELPIELLPINFELDGNFPAHEADPLKIENLKELTSFIQNNSVDLGITTDGDGDRIFFLDEQGKLISPAIIRGILSKIFLEEKPGSKIGYDVRPGKITEDLIKENGGKAIKTKVGHSLIKKQMLEEGLFFAGESSGHFYLNLDIGCFEMPVIIIGKILIELSQNNLKASQYFAPYNKYFHSGEINCLVKDKQKTIEQIELSFKDGKINKLDGLSVDFPDFWFNVRGSNTENKLRLNLEAKNQKIMEEKRDEILKIING